MELRGLCCAPAPGRAGIRRRRIIDAARILFIANGFHATGVAQIARLSGVAVGQIYRDFDSKEEIVAEIVESDCAVLMARESLHQSIAAGDTAGVRAWIAPFIHPRERSATEPLLAEIMAESARNERIADIFARNRDDIRGAMLAALALLVPGDDIAGSRALLADMILTQSLGLMQYRLVQPDLDTDRLATAMMEVVTREIELMRDREAVA